MGHYNFFLENLSTTVWAHWMRTLESLQLTGFLCSLPHSPLPFADFVLYAFTLINHNYGVNYTMGSVSHPSKLSNMEVVSGTQDICYLCIYVCMYVCLYVFMHS